jgi:exodeoxyribonuclease VII large subunit
MNSFPLFQPSSLTVTELTRYLRNLFDTDEVLSDIWVQGEISNLSRPSSGHLYFTLKDGGASLRCVIWRTTAMRLRFGFQNGLAIEAHGAISIYERDGAYQLYVDSVRPAGEGLLFQEFLRLKTCLEAEGLFDPERKRAIPQRPNCIGVVTSPTGAALQDMLNTLRTRYPMVEVLLAPCAVQGDNAPAEIARAIQALCQSGQPDLLIVARGGGSLEDLWAFNDERVVRAIALSAVPVITGVGHETDFTLADFAADVRAPTPTGAAVTATPDRADLVSDLTLLHAQLNASTFNILAGLRLDLDDQRRKLDSASPVRRMQNERQALDHLEMRADRAATHGLQLRRARLEGLRSRLDALNPTAVLQRGYAIVQRADGEVVHSVGATAPGDTLHLHMRDGKLVTRVESVERTQTNTSRT